MPPLPDLSGLTSLIQFAVACVGAYVFALWIAMIVWTYRDIRARSRDIFTQVLSVVLVLVFNLPGLLLYFILRPRETLAEKYERELAGEALLQDIEERQVCPVCHHKITPEFLVCPNCHTKLHKKCENCGRVLNLKWTVCPFCGEPQGVPATTARPPTPTPTPTPPPPPVRERRRESLPTAPPELPPAPRAAPAESTQ